MDQTKLYIAEMDEDGRVVWVWVARTHTRAARPFIPTFDKFDPTVPAEFSGAQPKAIMSWLATCQESVSSRHHRGTLSLTD